MLKKKLITKKYCKNYFCLLVTLADRCDLGTDHAEIHALVMVDASFAIVAGV